MQPESIEDSDISSGIPFERLQAVHQAVGRLAAEGSPERLLADLLAEAVGLLEGTGGTVMRWDESRGALVSVRRLASKASEQVVLRRGQGAGGRAIARRATVILNDYRRACRGETPAAAGVRAAIATPLLHDDRLLGALTVHSAGDKRFSREDAELLELLVGLASAMLVGLERARLEGVLLAARTAQHELNNKLALTTGYAEMLKANPSLPPELREAAAEAQRGAEAAVGILYQLQRVTRL